MSEKRRASRVPSQRAPSARSIVVQVRRQPALDFLQRHAFALAVVEDLVAIDLAEAVDSLLSPKLEQSLAWLTLWKRRRVIHVDRSVFGDGDGRQCREVEGRARSELYR
jgi:hypothetical protein